MMAPSILSSKPRSPVLLNVLGISPGKVKDPSRKTTNYFPSLYNVTNGQFYSLR